MTAAMGCHPVGTPPFATPLPLSAKQVTSRSPPLVPTGLAMVNPVSAVVMMLVLVAARTIPAGAVGETVIVVLVVDVAPVAVDAVRVTVYVPASVYVVDGFCEVEVLPLPKSHDHDVGLPVEVSVNCTANGAVPDVGDAVKLATTGMAWTVTVVVAEVAPPALDAVRVTVYVPALAYVVDGFCDVEVLPLPKSHDHDVGLPVEVSVNCTANGAVPDVGDAVKLAVGAVAVPRMVRSACQ